MQEIASLKPGDKLKLRSGERATVREVQAGPPQTVVVKTAHGEELRLFYFTLTDAQKVSMS